METVKWRFLDSGKGSAFFNMALDEAILKAVMQGVSTPTFRVYEWEQNALTFGYSQKIDDIIDRERVEKDRIEITRRLTGGSAVFHCNEIAYSIVGSIDNEHFGGNITDSYKSVSNVIVNGFRALGIGAEMSLGNLPEYVDKTKRFSAPCFATASKYEVTLDGKKIVGSAQRRFRKYFLQQGSIIIGPGHEKITEYMKDNDYAAEFRKQLISGTVDLRSLFSVSFSISRLKDSLFDSFRKTVCAQCEFEEPIPEEFEYAKRLMNEKYNSKGWIFSDG